jgi:DNA mismatch repair protein MutS
MVLFATHYFELTRLAQTTPAAVNLHLAAAEHHGGIVFLHEVRPGPANRSYGLQVARLAGVPAAVIRKAGQLLGELEARARADDDQFDLFALDPLAEHESAHGAGTPFDGLPRHGHAGADPDGPDRAARPDDIRVDPQAARVAAALAAIDPDTLNPRQALEALYRLRALLDDERPA